MRVLIAPTAFKGTYTPFDAAQSMQRGWRSVRPHDEIRLLPTADGGDGTIEVLLQGSKPRILNLLVPDAMGEPRAAALNVLEDGTAFADVASSCGMVAMKHRHVDPLRATTRAVGVLALAAAEARCSRLIVAMGGSASTDAGVGAAHELGARFFDGDGNELEPHPVGLTTVERVTAATAPLPIVGLVDVPGPLLGPRGAARMFARQKGASRYEIAYLERFLERLSDCVDAASVHTPGAVAGGGLGWGLSSLVDATLTRGTQLVAETIGLDAAVNWADMVVTGEGRLDTQTALGKSVADVANRSVAAGAMCVAAVGANQLGPAAALALGLDMVVADPDPGVAAAALARGYSQLSSPEKEAHVDR